MYTQTITITNVPNPRQNLIFHVKRESFYGFMKTRNKRATLIFLCLCTVIWCSTSRSLMPTVILCGTLIHELGHILAAYALKNSINSISTQSGGLLLSRKKLYNSYVTEALIALAGPFANISAAGAISLFSTESTLFFRQTNIALAILNLFPINAFDGSKVLQCFAYLTLPYKYAYFMCSLVSFAALFFLWGISVYVLLKSGNNVTFFLFSAIIFLRAATKQE